MLIDFHTHYHNYELHGEGIRFEFEDFVHELKFHNIDKAVVSNAFFLETDFIYGNRLLFDFMQQYPDYIIGFIVLHPLFFDECISILEEGIAKGIKGVKLHCELTHTPYTFASHIELIELISEYDIPITLHTGLKYIEDCIYLAKRFPEITFIFGHAGGLGYKELLTNVRGFNNIMVDVCGDVYVNNFIEDVVNLIGDERVVYGSDFVFMDPVILMEMIKNSKITDRAKENLLGKNAERILKI